MTLGGSSIPEVQALLRVLAAGRLRAAERAKLAREALAQYENVLVVEGEWHDALAPDGPFDFLFVDVREAKTDPRILDLGAPGALFVIDDLTPGYPGPDGGARVLAGQPTPCGNGDHDDSVHGRNRRRAPDLTL